MGVLDARTPTAVAILAVASLAGLAAVGLPPSLGGDRGVATAVTGVLVAGLVIAALLAGRYRADEGYRTPYW